MSINQTQLHDSLQELAQAQETADFIYGFLDAYGFPKSTIAQLKNGGTRNVAKISGDVALKKQLYFQPMSKGNVHEAAEQLKNSDIIRSQSIRFVIVTNFKELVAYDLVANERMETPFNEIHKNYSFFLPLAGYEKSYSHAESVADVKAAEKMGRLFELIRERNKIETAEDAHALNVFLTRLLFCFFAEDTGIFGQGQFTTTIESTTREDGSDVAEFLARLFTILNTPSNGKLRESVPAHFSAFPYVNGGLFEKVETVPEFGAKSRRLLIECGTLNWSEINPDIFGSMFQAVIDDDQRSTFGQHYTSVTNIMKVIKPLFLDKLYAELERARQSEKKLQALLDRVGHIKVFDPACGSGNFLIIAYKELRRFEMEVFRALNDVSKQVVIFFTNIKLTQFYGIEIDDFAHEIALLSMWLTEHQMHKEFESAFGHVEPMLPLKSSGNIHLGNSLRLDWNSICPKAVEDEVYVIGNPPFLGTTERSSEQSDDMKNVFDGFGPLGYLDIVACWFWKGANYIQNTKSELAFVSTNSICQGEQVATLWPSIFKLGVSIHFAYQAFVWKNSAKNNAGVHVVVVGLSSEPEQKQIFKLIGDEWHNQTAKNISPYLTDGSNLAVVNRSKILGNVAAMVYGNKPTDGGYLLLNSSDKEELISKEPQAEKWIKRLYGAEEFINSKDRWCLWLVSATEKDLQSMPEVQKRTIEVAKLRLKAGHPAALKMAKKPHIFIQVSQPESGSYILVPRVSSERREYVPIGLLDHSVIASDAIQMIPGGGLYEFGILNSIIHNDWMRAVGGRLKSDYRYSATLVYNTFPWPDATDSQRKVIETLAEDVLMARENYPEKSLAFLHDPDTMPENLKLAHKSLDKAVERLYRIRTFRDTSERLEILFSRYEKLIEVERQELALAAKNKKLRKIRSVEII